MAGAEALVRALAPALDPASDEDFALVLRVAELAQTLPPPVGQAAAQSVLLQLLELERWHEDASALDALRPLLMRLGRHYLACERRRGRAACPVANFHLRNGASMHRLNWLADPTPRGLAQSAGMMVNYLYDLDACDANNEAYTMDGTIRVDEPFDAAV